MLVEELLREQEETKAMRVRSCATVKERGLRACWGWLRSGSVERFAKISPTRPLVDPVILLTYE